MDTVLKINPRVHVFPVGKEQELAKNYMGHTAGVLAPLSCLAQVTWWPKPSDHMG